jgi:hypothetical protein
MRPIYTNAYGWRVRGEPPEPPFMRPDYEQRRAINRHIAVVMRSVARRMRKALALEATDRPIIRK